jgi:hypothetical protein
MSNNQKEQKYFESVARMRTSASLQGKIWDASDIYKEVQPNEDSSYEFLHKCYTDTVMETVGLIRFISRHVHDGVFVKPTDPMELPDDDEYDYYDDHYDEDYNEIEILKKEKKEYKRTSFMRSVICALSEMKKARMKLADSLLKRCLSDQKLIDDFAQYSQGNHHLLSKGHTLIGLYRCLRHIRLGVEIPLDYETSELAQFDKLFCVDNNIVDEYVACANKGICDSIDMFDPAITNHNKSENWKPITFAYKHTEEVIAMR